MGYKQGTAGAADSLVMGTVGKRKEKPAPTCSAIPKLALELKQIIHCASHPKLPQITPCKMGLPLGQLNKGASLEELLESCIHSFDSEGNLCRSGSLLQITVTMHRFLVSSTDLMVRLRTLYEEASEKKLSARCLKICYFVRYWMTEFWLMFKVDSSLRDTMETFRDVVNTYDEKMSRHLLDTSQITSRDFPWKLTQRIKSHTSKKRKVSLLFDHLEPQELAEHLTYLEFKSFRRISFSDYQNYIVHSSVKDNPTMERSVSLCNGISQWVQLMVLSRPTPQLRAEVLTKFIHVAQKLHHLQNFNTLMAVIGGLCHSSISRLKETSCHVPHEVNKVLNEMTELLSSCRNYDNYRRVYSECTGFKIPILGVHLKDLISLYEAMPDYLEGRKINVPKLHSLYNHINELVQLQQVAPPLEANKDLVHLLTLSLDLYYTEDEIYELSYAREPRNHRIPPPTPSKPPVVADWASGVAPKPDPKTISKHVQRMVDSVFKNYDLDQDGYISQDEFEKIAASFPFSFCVMDKDREGLISREEITAYFIRASSIYSKLGLGFPHNFQETTYLRPTFCDNCAGFLWGVIKQGYRCKDCGMNCHKQCKELVVFECKKRSNSSSSAENSPNSGITAAVLCPAGMKGLMNGSDEALFTFPSREGIELTELPEEIKDRTIMLVGSAAPKIARRMKNLASDKSTQTDHGMSGCDGLARHYAIHHRKAYAKWDNKNSTRNVRNQDGASTPDRQELEQERDALQTQNETLKVQLQDAQRRIEDLQMELKNHPFDSTDHNSCS